MLFQADALQKHRNSTVSKSDDFSTVEFIGNFFEQVEDSWQDWKVKHTVSEIPAVVMCGVSAGERSIYGIREFARLKEQWLKDVIALKVPAGLPSYDTVRRVLGLLDPKPFQDVFIR